MTDAIKAKSDVLSDRELDCVSGGGDQGSAMRGSAAKI